MRNLLAGNILAIAVFLLLASAGSSITLPGKAQAFDRTPECTSTRVLRKVAYRFNQTERIYWKHRGLRLREVVNPHHHSTNPFPDSPIYRYYCHGDAVMSDGKTRRIHYLIEQNAGFAGITWNVEYCIHGLDPWHYYGGRCRSISR